MGKPVSFSVRIEFHFLVPWTLVSGHEWSSGIGLTLIIFPHLVALDTTVYDGSRDKTLEKMNG